MTTDERRRPADRTAEITTGIELSASTIPPTGDSGTQGALLGPDLVVPATPTNATAGAQRADANASPWNRDGAYRYLVLLATSGRTFTADDLRDSGHVNDDHANRIGGLFMAASRSGLIQCVGAVPSRTGSRHGGLVRIWRGTEAARGAQ